jgi:hypothetical protein
MSLLFDPGEEMVGDRREIETRLFGALSILDQFLRPMLSL